MSKNVKVGFMLWCLLHGILLIAAISFRNGAKVTNVGGTFWPMGNSYQSLESSYDITELIIYIGLPLALYFIYDFYNKK